MSIVRRTGALSVFFLVWLGGAQARGEGAEEKRECISASDQGQQLRDDGKYHRAREAFVRCARETCPAMLRQDCARWLVDLDQRSATVVINAKDDKGRDLADVTVTVDGEPLVDKLDGTPVAVDPGAHVLHFSTSGFPFVEEHLVIHAAEKNRQLNVQFGGAAVQSGAANANTAGSMGQRTAIEGVAAGASVPRANGPPVVAWVFAGVAVAAFASEGFFGISGLSRRSSDLAPGGCAPHCAPSEKSDIQTEFVIADVSLGVAVLSAGLSAYFFLRRSASEPPIATPSTAIDFAPRPGGGVLELSRRF